MLDNTLETPENKAKFHHSNDIIFWKEIYIKTGSADKADEALEELKKRFK